MSSQPQAHPNGAQQLSFTVEMFRDPDEPGRGQFSCTLRDWDFMRELGKTFGWLPVGTTYLLRHGQRSRLVPIKHDYQPGDSRDRKRIEARDCAQWAAALEVARRSPFIEGMLQAHAQLDAPGDEGKVRSLQLLLRNFIQFAGAGPFTIALRREH